MTRKIPPSGINIFQLIYQLIREYSDKTGLSPLNLSLGNPDTVPDREILDLQAQWATNPAYELHTYAEDNNIGDFAEEMVALHGGILVEDYAHLATVPIPGIKGASTLVALACGLHLPDRDHRRAFHVVSNLPAYDVIGTWSSSYLSVNRIVWPLRSADNMRLNLDCLTTALQDADVEQPDLIFVIRPGNPAAVGASEDEWKALIEFCIERQIRLVNDAAYIQLSADPQSVALASVAANYPEMEWIEMYSVSKSFSDPGARLGALVGSQAFVEDFILIKGNTDSGPVPYIMAAYGEFFKDADMVRQSLNQRCDMYQQRLDYMIPRLLEAGLQPACHTEAGFFTLWKTPKRVLGVDLETDPKTRDFPLHEAFNRLVISETGLVGVHFQGPEVNGIAEPFIRYAVCTDVLNPEFQSRFEAQLSRLKPEY